MPMLLICHKISTYQVVLMCDIRKYFPKVDPDVQLGTVETKERVHDATHGLCATYNKHAET